MKVCLGGTFNMFHAGHKRLFNLAFSISDQVIVGLTSDAFANALGKEARPFEERKQTVLHWYSKVQVVKLEDDFGPALTDPDMTVIVVSTETRDKAEELNLLREQEGLKALIVVVAPIVKLHGKKMSSSLLMKKDIK